MNIWDQNEQELPQSGVKLAPSASPFKGYSVIWALL